MSGGLGPPPASCPHRAALRALGLAAPAAERLVAYLDLLARWSRRVNLTAARTPARRVELLVTPALALAPGLEPGSLIDVGSGNGSPGLVLAVLRPDLQTTLLEPRLRRWSFLREAARAVGLPEARVRRERYQAYRGAPAANVTARGLGAPPEALARLVCDGGQLLLSGQRRACSPPLAWEAELGAGPARFQRYRRAAAVSRGT